MTNDTITHESRLSLRLTLVLCGAVLAVAGAWYHMTALVQGVRHELKLMNVKIEGIVLEQSDHIGRSEWRAWVREFRAANQGLNQNLVIPMPD